VERIRALASMLGKRRESVATACHLLHRTVCIAPMERDIPSLYASVCFFLACKVEDDAVKMRDVINASSALDDPGKDPPPLDASYWQTKEKYVSREQFVLRCCGFAPEIEHPFRVCLRTCSDLECDPIISRKAIEILEDGCYTSCLFHRASPSTMALAAIAIAATARPQKPDSRPGTDDSYGTGSTAPAFGAESGTTSGESAAAGGSSKLMAAEHAAVATVSCTGERDTLPNPGPGADASGGSSRAGNVEGRGGAVSMREGEHVSAGAAEAEAAVGTLPEEADSDPGRDGDSEWNGDLSWCEALGGNVTEVRRAILVLQLELGGRAHLTYSQYSMVNTSSGTLPVDGDVQHRPKVEAD